MNEFGKPTSGNSGREQARQSRRGIDLPVAPTNDRPADRWQCGLAGSETCLGPGNARRCPHAEGCRPTRTWHGRKALAFRIAAILLLAGLVPLIWAAVQPTSFQAALIRPGDLTTAHAQIIRAGSGQDGCVMCHEQAATISQWFGAVGTPHAGVRQTDRCLNCHHQTIPKESARWAHQLSPKRRAEIASDQFRRQSGIRLASTSGDLSAVLPSAATSIVDSDAIECNACHREHHGAEHSLTAMSQTQCQSCHSQSFGSFAHGHPSFTRYPYGITEVGISFDHRTHATKHFPQSSLERKDFDCGTCHTPLPNGELSRTVSFETGCQACHDDSLRTGVADGITLLQLPIIDRNEATRIGGWPEAAIGHPEPAMSALQSLFAEGDRIDEAAAMREFAISLSQRGQQAGIERLIKSGIERATAERIFAAFSPQVMSDAIERWFPRQSKIRAVVYQSGDELLSDNLLSDELLSDELLSDELLSDGLLDHSDDDSAGDDLLLGGSFDNDSNDDDLLLDLDAPDDVPLSVPDATAMPRAFKVERFESATMMPGGGWYRDDLTFSIRYRGGSHDDPTLKAIIEAMHQVGSSASMEELTTNPAIKTCLECHQSMDPRNVSAARSWTQSPWVGRLDRSTKFSHVPHLNIASIADCKSCHKVRSSDSVNLASFGTQSSEATTAHEFEPMDQVKCASCHQKGVAADACTTCHRYHIRSSIPSQR